MKSTKPSPPGRAAPRPPFRAAGLETDAALPRPGAARPAPRHDRRLRCLNIALAAAGLLLAAPLMLLIALLIKAASPGPVLYTQLRVGINRRNGGPPRPDSRRRVDYGGRLFKIYKFRTMRLSGAAEEVWAAPNDPRITAIGRILRTYRLDELPQLFNVLKGDMNLVGPRPEQPRIFIRLCEQVDGYQHRQAVLPGITGWAQVNQHYDTCVDDVRRKLHYDLEYIRRRSLREDLKILARTVPVVLFRRGAW